MLTFEYKDRTKNYRHGWYDVMWGEDELGYFEYDDDLEEWVFHVTKTDHYITSFELSIINQKLSDINR